MRTRFRRSQLRLAAVLVGLVLVLGAAATLASGAQTAHQTRASLTLKSLSPVTVQGSGFRPRTRVRVALVESQMLVRRPIVSSHGTFTTTFPAVIDRCSAWSISASQPGRAPAMLRGAAKPECAPASTP
jgi:hypothetical protein